MCADGNLASLNVDCILQNSQANCAPAVIARHLNLMQGYLIARPAFEALAELRPEARLGAA